MANIGSYRLNDITTGDSRLLAQSIPDECIDLIIADPVYWEVNDYLWLAETAKRILKDGGNLIMQSGKIYFLDIAHALHGCGLEYQTIIAEIYAPFKMRNTWKSKTLEKWKPYFWFSKNKRMGEWCYDAYYSNSANFTKKYHKWGDGVGLFATYIERLVMPDGIVYDPFTGSGTVPIACKITQRNFIASEIDPEQAEKASRHYLQASNPLGLGRSLTQLAPDAGESAPLQADFYTPAESTSPKLPKPTQRG